MVVSEAMARRLSSASSIREAFERAENLKAEYGADCVFDFSIGNPTAPCPEGVDRALMRTVQGHAPHGYMQAAGYEDVRHAVAHSLTTRYGTPLSPDDIIMTTGAACALNIAMQAVLDPGDEVVAFLPCYPAYRPFAQNWGARLRTVPFDPATLLPDMAAFKAALNERTKMVIANTPNNPSGLVYPPALARQIADALNDYRHRTGCRVLLASDEPYRDLLYDGAENPWWPALYDDTVVVYSFSKSASIAGERIGYVLVNPAMEDAAQLRAAMLRSLGDLGFVNAPATAQRMALECAGECADVAYYQRNRDVLYAGLRSAGFAPVRPNGAFYLLLPAPDGNEETLLKRLEAQRIVAVGGADFGCPGYVRLSFCLPPEAVQASLPGFDRVAAEYGLATCSGETAAIAGDADANAASDVAASTVDPDIAVGLGNESFGSNASGAASPRHNPDIPSIPRSAGETIPPFARASVACAPAIPAMPDAPCASAEPAQMASIEHHASKEARL